MNNSSPVDSAIQQYLPGAVLVKLEDNSIGPLAIRPSADDNSSDSDDDLANSCKTCPDIFFKSEDDLHSHLKQFHVQQPTVTLQRAKEWYIRKCVDRRVNVKKHRSPGGIAKKHTQSFGVVRKQPALKVTLKLASDSTGRHRSFEVVPSHNQAGSVLLGPGEVYHLNGYGSDEVKKEIVERPLLPLPRTVEGVTEKLVVEAGEGALEGEGPRLSGGEGEKTDQNGHDVTSEEEEGDGGIDIKENLVVSPETGAKLLEEVCRATSDNLARRDSLEEEEEEEGGAPSPSPSEQLRPDYLASNPSPTPSERSDFLGFPNEEPDRMVELSATSNSEVPSASPTFPTESGETDPDGSKQLEEVAPFQVSNFTWEGSDGQDAASASDVDPLQLPEPITNANMQVMSNDSLLRGFLAEDKHNNVPAAVPITSEAILSLGSEYISLDRLGDNSQRCEVCGERAATREALDEHRSKAGHYKCNRPECCGKVFPNAEELAVHLQTSHAQFPRVIVNQSLQSPPVQQLQQQVQRLPMPQPQQSYLNQALSANMPMVQLPQHAVHPQQVFPQTVGRPPVYRVPAPVNMAPPPHMTAQYANTQQMMSQMYNQQQFHQQVQQGFHPQQQQQQQQQQQMSLGAQRPNYIQQMQQMQRPQQPQQQRMAHPMQRPQAPQIRAKRIPPGLSPNAKRQAEVQLMGVQKRQNVDPTKRPLPDSMIHLTESITLSVRQPPAVTMTPIPAKKPEAKSVANVLASRGITVTAAGGGARPAPAVARAAPVSPVATLNFNSAISIIPTGSSGGQAGSSGFAVPQNKSRQPQTTAVERPPRPPTVDLTGDGPMQRSNQPGRGRMRGRPPGSISGRLNCQICDKAFTTPEVLNQHMQLHRSPGKLPFRCNLCQAQYPTQQGLIQHRQSYHKEPASGPELAIPVVDLKQPGVLARLLNLGIANYIPLSQLSSPQGGHFGLPIVSVDGARDPAVSNISAIASNILSLGPIKQLPR